MKGKVVNEGVNFRDFLRLLFSNGTVNDENIDKDVSAVKNQEDSSWIVALETGASVPKVPSNRGSRIKFDKTKPIEPVGTLERNDYKETKKGKGRGIGE